MSPSTLPQMRPVKVTLPGLPREPLSPAQQAEALRRIQAQAEQRVQLGVQLFKAAESQAARHRDMLDAVKAENASFRSEIEEDIARSFHAYDTWIGQADSDLTSSIKKLEEKMEKLQSDWQNTQTRIEGMVERSERLLSQTRDLMESGRTAPAAPMMNTEPSMAPSDEEMLPPSPSMTMFAPPPDNSTSQQPLESAQTSPEGEPPPADLPPNFYTKLVDRLDGDNPPKAQD